MARILLCIALVAGLAACDDGESERLRERIAVVTAERDEARDGVDELRRELRDLRDQEPVDLSRYVDIYGGGPTMSGPFLALPRLGVMRWRCNDDFGFRIVFEARAATVYVAHDTPAASGARVAHPGQEIGATIAEGETMTWTITHRHKPGFIRARITISTERSRQGQCLLGRVEVDETSRTYD